MDVLIIDDDKDVRSLHTTALEKAGYMVKSVDNGLAALAELQQHEYQVIVSDIGMEILQGDQLFEEIRKLYPRQADRVIFVTGWANEPWMRDFLQKTGRPFLAKPVDQAEFVEAVARVAGTRKKK
jgi:CheY-like chemotaxis protein